MADGERCQPDSGEDAPLWDTKIVRLATSGQRAISGKSANSGQSADSGQRATSSQRVNSCQRANGGQRVNTLRAGAVAGGRGGRLGPKGRRPGRETGSGPGPGSRGGVCVSASGGRRQRRGGRGARGRNEGGRGLGGFPLSHIAPYLRPETKDKRIRRQGCNGSPGGLARGQDNKSINRSWG